nr:MAG TPA: hypothetical protein [Caudoviricetes sp.]
MAFITLPATASGSTYVITTFSNTDYNTLVL